MKICCFFLLPLQHLFQVHCPFILHALAPNSWLFYLFLTIPNSLTILDNFTLFGAWPSWYHFQRFSLPFCVSPCPFLPSPVQVYLKSGKFMDNHMGFYLCLSTDRISKLLIRTLNFRISLPSLIIFSFTVSGHGLINLALLWILLILGYLFDYLLVSTLNMRTQSLSKVYVNSNH